MDPPSGSFSQKQPPACICRLMLLAEPDQVCSGCHQRETSPSSRNTVAGGPLMVTVDWIEKAVSRDSVTPAHRACGPETANPAPSRKTIVLLIGGSLSP